MPKTKPVHFEASLIVEAVTPSDVRSSHFKQAWSRLFSAGDYFIDLAFEMKPEIGELRGQVLLPSNTSPIGKGKVKLAQNEQVLAEASLDASGTFVLGLKQIGEHQLFIELKNTLLTIPTMEFR